ncbi:hypothetical protein ACHELL_004184 [Vibrio vulnificus]|uniref:hypothetical protein n=1 Tax=Vibrio parahaemolyticus TaxID=670 RepID=UPI0037C2EE29|nr:hypothetical protein [Vibrio parahaemolyticus]
MKPRGTNNAAENELTTPKNAFGKPISQCGVSTKEFSSINPKVATPKNKPTVKKMPILNFTTLVNTEIEHRYDNLDFQLLPLDLAI